MDFGLGKQRPERVNIEVLRDMITDSPEQMSVAARRWLSQEAEEQDDREDSQASPDTEMPGQ